MHVLIRPDYRIWQACAQDDTRPVLTGVLIDVEREVAIAADGFMLAIVPCTITKDEGEGPNRLLLPKALVKESKGFGITVKDGFAETLTKNGLISMRLLEGTYPNIDNLVPKKVAAKPTHTTGFNYKYVQRLADAIALPFQFVVLHESEEGPGIPFVMLGDSGAIGVLMPMTAGVNGYKDVNGFLAEFHKPKATPKGETSETEAVASQP